MCRYLDVNHEIKGSNKNGNPKTQYTFLTPCLCTALSVNLYSRYSSLKHLLFTK